MNQFNKKKDRLLIQLVKNYPVLYDPSNANFKNCIVKHKVWECISNSMQIPSKCFYPTAKSMRLRIAFGDLFCLVPTIAGMLLSFCCVGMIM